MRIVLKDVKETQKVSVENENVVQLIEEAFKHITNVYDRNKLKEQIIFALLDNKIDQQKIDKSEIQIFASRVCNLLDAESKKIEGIGVMKTADGKLPYSTGACTLS